MKPVSNTCPEIQAQLPLYVGGDLESTEAAELVRQHVVACTSCAGELARLCAALESIDALHTERLPEIDVWPSVRAELINSGVLRVEPSAAPLPASAPAASQLRAVAQRRVASYAWRYVAAAAFMLGAGLALWNVSNTTTPEQDPLGPGAVALEVPKVTPNNLEVVDVTPVEEQAKLQPTLIEDAHGLENLSGLHKVGADEEALWRSARPFGAQYAPRRPSSAWQTASYPIQDPRVR